MLAKAAGRELASVRRSLFTNSLITPEATPPSIPTNSPTAPLRLALNSKQCHSRKAKIGIEFKTVSLAKNRCRAKKIVPCDGCENFYADG